MSGNVFQDLRYGVGKLLYASPVYRYTLIGRAPNELAIVLADDALVRALNKGYRGIDKATNVLAFRYADGETAPAPGEALGDVVVALETARREAETAGRSLHEHLSHLVIHGVLHLLGYDHANDPDAETMENLEIQALAGIGITNPYMPAGAMTKK